MIPPSYSRGCWMEFSIRGTAVRIGFTSAAFVCILLIAFRPATVCQVLAAVFLHECGHLACAAACGLRPREITLSARGVRMAMDLELLPAGRRFGVALCGPLVNLMLCLPAALLARRCGPGIWSEGFWIHGALGLLNLLPIPGLDGGDLLRIVLTPRLTPEKLEKVLLIVGGIVLVPAGAAYFLLLLRGIASGGSLLLFAYIAVLLASEPAAGMAADRG